MEATHDARTPSRKRRIDCRPTDRNAGGSSATGADTTPVFEWPVRCVVSEDCFLRYFVDHVEGPSVCDYACGNLTYDGHKSTDIRVRDLAAMRRGFEVPSAAPGVVKAVRDDEPPT